MRLKSIELAGFKSFVKKTQLEFDSSITAIVGPNGSGKSNIAESFRFVLGEQSMKSMRGRRGEDLIWNGGAGSPRAGRGSVKLVFDNRPVGGQRALNLDFDEVMIERVVHRDGDNDYVLNGSHVRLRDVAELLSQANIGSSGHHIISQGEADRILSSSSRERREMVEDALGLTAFLYKKLEAERKLEKTGENMREVESLRRELAPHLRFLQSQVKKIEESQKLRGDLEEKYLEYLKRENVYLSAASGAIVRERAEPAREHARLDAQIAHLREELARKQGNADASELVQLEEEGRAAASRREAALRELGRIEGEISAHEKLSRVVEEAVPAAQVREFAERVEKDLGELQLLEGQTLRSRLIALAIFAKEFLRRINTGHKGERHSGADLPAKKVSLEKELHQLQGEETRVAKAVASLRKKIENEKDASRESERELFGGMARRSELQTVLAGLRAREEALAREQEQFKFELAEAVALLGRAAAGYESYKVEKNSTGEPRAAQEERRRKLERMKIKLEEIGSGNSAEVLKEHHETSERDQFLARELGDLSTSSESLRGLIQELTATLETRFTSGIEKINTEFENYFKLMFGGGEAQLAVVKEKRLRRAVSTDGLGGEGEMEEEMEVEEGIEITVSLPHKRIKGLHMLSGGERALTSIALIFAMSQVNPPPFLILDETDAALDEANSRRYGDMIENLAKKSQLILITHNRETMSRAGVLYGITMGQDGISKLLSVKFEEALAVAK